METYYLKDLILNKCSYRPFHRYFVETDYDVDFIDLYKKVIDIFFGKSIKITEPAYSIYRMICYAFTINKFFKLDIFKCLEEKELLFDNKYIKHSNYMSLYKDIIKAINNPFIFQNTDIIIKQCKEEYGIEMLPINSIAGCFITPKNKIFYNSRNLTHSRYLISKSYIKQEKNTVNKKIDHDYIVIRSINLGWIRINIENDFMCITSKNILSPIKKRLIHTFYKEHTPKTTNNFIFENEYNSTNPKQYPTLTKLLQDN